MTVSGLEVRLWFGFRWPFLYTAPQGEDVFRTAGRVREEVPLHPPMSRPGVEGCEPAQRTFLSWGKFGPEGAKSLSGGPQ
jgi:hypothetical protein